MVKKNTNGGRVPNLMKVIDGYTPDEAMKGSRAKQIADAIHYVSMRLPGVWIMHTHIAKMIYGRKKTPRATDKDTLGVAGSIGRARIVYEETYGDTITSLPRIGCRATVSSEDTAATEMIKVTERAGSAFRAQKRVRGQIDLDEVKDLALHEYVARGLDPSIKAIDQHADKLRGLLLKAKGEDAELEKKR